MPSYAAQKFADPKIQSMLEVAATGFGTAHANHPKIETLRDIVPFDQYALSGIDYPGLGIGGGVMLASDMPQAFLRDFVSQGLFRFDPLATLVSVNRIWGSWHDLTAEDLARPELAPIKALHRAHGVSTRTVVGFYRGDFCYGGATFARETPFTDREKFILEAGGRMVHTELSRQIISKMSAHAGLSGGEIRCLKAASDGLGAEAAAASTGYTVETYTSYIKSATKKLAANNRTHAVAEAIRRRMID